MVKILGYEDRRCYGGDCGYTYFRDFFSFRSERTTRCFEEG